jgi:hypothetical protein
VPGLSRGGCAAMGLFNSYQQTPLARRIFTAGYFLHIGFVG